MFFLPGIRYGYMSTWQLLGLEERPATANKEDAVTRGAYLSFLLLRHLRLRELKVKKNSAWIKVIWFSWWGGCPSTENTTVCLFWFVSESVPGNPELLQICGEKPYYQYRRPQSQGWSSDSQHRRYLLDQCCKRRHRCFWRLALSALRSLHTSWLQGEVPPSLKSSKPCTLTGDSDVFLCIHADCVVIHCWVIWGVRSACSSKLCAVHSWTLCLYLPVTCNRSLRISKHAAVQW